MTTAALIYVGGNLGVSIAVFAFAALIAYGQNTTAAPCTAPEADEMTDWFVHRDGNVVHVARRLGA